MQLSYPPHEPLLFQYHVYYCARKDEIAEIRAAKRAKDRLSAAGASPSVSPADRHSKIAKGEWGFHIYTIPPFLVVCYFVIIATTLDLILSCAKGECRFQLDFFT